MPIERREVLLLMAALPVGGFTAGGASAEAPALGKPSKDPPMEKVAGIGGLFFRAADPEALGRWYHDHLGIALVPTSYDVPSWHTEAGTTVFAPFPKDTDYFGAKTQQWMVNFRVHDLDKMAAQLKAQGIQVDIDPKAYPNGRFARLHDPEGNPIELWEPAAR
jgi:glyoxylase I family protein